MRINITNFLLASSLATSAVSMDILHEQERRNHLLSVLKQNQFFVQQEPPCSLPACSNLSSTINCVVSAIEGGNAAALQRCLTNGITDICQCAACISPLLSILHSIGVCVSMPTPEPLANPTSPASSTASTPKPTSMANPGFTTRAIVD